jgi:hypothetical protein
MAPRQQVNLQTVPSRAETLCCAWHPLLATALLMRICDRTWPQEESDGSVGGGRCLPRKTKEPVLIHTPRHLFFGREGGWLEVQDVPSEEEKAEECSHSLGMDRPTHMHTRTDWVFWTQARRQQKSTVTAYSLSAPKLVQARPRHSHPPTRAVNLRDSMSVRLPHFYEWRRYIPCFGSA